MDKRFVTSVVAMAGLACIAIPAAAQSSTELFRQARDYQSRGQLAEAIGMAGQAFQLAEEPELKAAIKMFSAECLGEEGIIDQCLGAWREVARIVPNTPQAAQGQYGVADTLRQSGKLSEALQELDAIRRTYPGTPESEDALVAIGEISETLGQFDKAIRSYQEYLDSYAMLPAAARALAGLGSCLQQQRQFQPALAAYQRVVRDYPLSYPVQSGLVGLAMGECLSGIGQTSKAVETFREVARSQPEMPRVTDALGAASDALLRAGDAAGAIGVLQQLASRYPNTIVALNAQRGIAQLRVQRGDLRGALSVLQQLDRQYGNTQQGFVIKEQLAEVLTASGAYEPAVKVYEALMQAAPRASVAPRAQLAIAECYARGGASKMAGQTLQQALAAYRGTPYETVATQMLARLEELTAAEE